MKQHTPKTNQPAAQNRRVAAPLDPGALSLLWAGCFGADAQRCLSELTALAKQKRTREWIEAQVNRGQLRRLLLHDAPKVRKNAARLLGALHESNRPEDAGALAEALAAEQTLFVVPSMILALGRFDDERARKAIESALARLEDEPIGEIAENASHIREIRAAANLAFSRHSSAAARTFSALPPGYALELRAAIGCGGLLAQEAQERGIPLMAQSKDSVQTQGKHYLTAQSLRCLYEALIPLGTCPLPPANGKIQDLDSWAASLDGLYGRFEKLIAGSLSPMPIPFRIELKNVPHEQRAPIARVLASALSARKTLQNAVSGYDAELRLAVEEKQCRCCAKLFVPKDQRFAYRKNALPASIHPVIAASLIRFAQPYLRPKARVIDPCCGSGTLLVERAKLSHCSQLLGVDIDAKALRIARENAQAAGQPADFVGGDLARFRPQAPFDECIANLPFGTRVGTQESVTAVHEALVKRLDDFLVPGGTAVLYTTQRRLLHKLAQRRGWSMLAEHPFSSGGLTPWGIVLRRPGRLTH